MRFPIPIISKKSISTENEACRQLPGFRVGEIYTACEESRIRIFELSHCLLPCDYHVLPLDNPVDHNSTEIIGLDQFYQTTSTKPRITADTDIES
jgi:hypothetical protein